MGGARIADRIAVSQPLAFCVSFPRSILRKALERFSTRWDCPRALRRLLQPARKPNSIALGSESPRQCDSDDCGNDRFRLRVPLELKTIEVSQRAIACNGRRHLWHLWHLWQFRVCNLLMALGLHRFKSHPLRLFLKYKKSIYPYVHRVNGSKLLTRALADCLGPELKLGLSPQVQ